MAIVARFLREASSITIPVLLACALACGMVGCGDENAAGKAPADALAADSAEVAGGPCAGKADGAACDDGDLCTSGDACKAGLCQGQPLACTAPVASGCTAGCDAKLGCVVKAPAGGCKIDDLCVAGGGLKPGSKCLTCIAAVSALAWTPTATACDDNNPCTTDVCLADGTCDYKDGTGACEDGNPCTAGDACEAGVCKKGKAKTACDDGNPCTKEVCIVDKGGCVAALDPLACDDKKPCTVDSCEAITGCAHKDLKAGDPCSAGDPCVTGQTCDKSLTCQGGGPLGCDDGNGCTNDSCKVGKGCVHTINKAPCDDGESCTTPDICTGGTCIGITTKSCPDCTKTYGASAAKLTVFQIGSSGQPGQGIDVDGKPDTCAPSTGCSGGINNALSVLAFFINKPLIAAVADGTLSYVAELEGYKGPEQAFTLNLYYAVLAPSSVAAGCNPQAQSCAWWVSKQALTAGCTAKFTFKNAVIKDGKLVAGGPDTLFAMDADLLGAKNATLYVKGARIEATVVFAKDGKTIESVLGILGGAVPKTAVIDIINSLDSKLFAQFSLTKGEVLALVDTVLELDIDTDGDGEGDAASIGLRFAGIGAALVGTDND